MASREASAVRPIAPWQFPSVQLALTFTAGIIFDFYISIPMAAGLAAAAIALLAWACTQARQPMAGYFLAAAVAALGACNHQFQCAPAPDQISLKSPAPGSPCSLRGTIVSSPRFAPPEAAEPLRMRPTSPQTRFEVALAQQQDLSTRLWRPASGSVEVHALGERLGVAAGDEVEVLGSLMLEAAANPGEASRDPHRGPGAVVVAQRSEVHVRGAANQSLAATRDAVRRWAEDLLAQHLPAQVPLACALLLGDGSALRRDDWDRAQRTGIVHALAISGQHLSILAAFLWTAARLLGYSQRQAGWAITLALVGYALLTGGQPPVMRAAWMTVTFTAVTMLRRVPLHALHLAFAWLLVAVTNPGDLFSAGCQLSFLAVAILLLAVRTFERGEPDPLTKVIEATESPIVTGSRRIFSALAWTYAVNGVVWLALTPLIAAHYHLVSPIALVIGPPVVLLTTVALLAGFVVLLTGAWTGPLVKPFAWLTGMCLQGCDDLVGVSERLPGAYTHVPDLPEAWLWGFYGVLIAALLTVTTRRTWRRVAIALGVWALVGAGWLLVGPPREPFRCTFLAVGHGGCTVLEIDGHVTLYDAGALTGPGVARRAIAPYLWHRGIRRIDRVILSHADLDHFNAVPLLAERFAIGEVLTTPSFAQREVPGVEHVLADLASRGISVGILHEGHRWRLGKVSFEVLHPPPRGPEGRENARSLVLLVCAAEHRLLLTGDLEAEGLEMLLLTVPQAVDVLMAPHHGSENSSPARLAAWASPRLVISSQQAPRFRRSTQAVYERAGATFLATWPDGAITLRLDGPRLAATTFQSKKTLALEPR